MRKPAAVLSAGHPLAGKQPEPFLKTRLVLTEDAGLRSAHGALPFALDLPKSILAGPRAVRLWGLG